MSVINGTFNQTVKGGRELGGTVVVFEGKPELLIGGFNFNIDDLPAPGDVLPCGTPVNCDEATRVITPVILATVARADGTKVTFKDNGFGQCPFKVGDTVGIVPTTLTDAATYYATVTAKNGNEVTLSGALTGAAEGTVVAVVDATSHKLKAVPNALLPYDVVRDADAISVDGDGAWKNDRPVLERRLPGITDAIKTALANAGCQFKWSNRK